MLAYDYTRNSSGVKIENCVDCGETPQGKTKMETKTFEVPNIGCEGCVRTIKNELSALAGVQRVEGSKDTRQVTVVFEAPATWDGIVAKLREIDYAPAEA
jgi:copper chaperone CopZ